MWPSLEHHRERPNWGLAVALGAQLVLLTSCGAATRQGPAASPRLGAAVVKRDAVPAEPASEQRASDVQPPSSYPVPCSPSEQSVCAELLAVDVALGEAQLERARTELARSLRAHDLIAAAAALTFDGESAVSCWKGLVVARTLLFSDSLSFGHGDENSRAAVRLLERIQAGAPPVQLVDRLQLDLARGYLALGDVERAGPLSRGLVERRPLDAEAQASLGIALLALGRVEESLGPLRRAQQLEPEEPERWLVLGTAQMLLGDAQAAERSFRAALAATSRAPASIGSTEEVLARCYGDLGAVLLVQGQAEQGRSYLERALQLRPKQATYRANLSYAEYLMGNFASAEAEARKAIASDARLIAAWLNLGLAQAAQKNLDEARRSFSHAQSLDPTDPRPGQSLDDLDELSQRSTESSP